MELSNELKLILHLLVAKIEAQKPEGKSDDDEYQKGEISGYADALYNLEQTVKGIEEL